jgi:hypothetical protein
MAALEDAIAMEEEAVAAVASSLLAGNLICLSTQFVL